MVAQVGAHMVAQVRTHMVVQERNQVMARGLQQGQVTTQGMTQVIA